MIKSLEPRRSSLAFFLVALFFALPATTFAAPSPFGNRQQEPLSGSVSDFYSPPAIFVDGITIPQSSIQAGDKVSGSFKIVSGESTTISDIQYRVELLSPAKKDTEKNNLIEDAATIYDKQLSKETLVLAPNETKSIPFVYNSPLVPGGEYRIRIQLTTSKEKTLGWDDTTITVQPNSILYADLAAGNITIPEYDNKGFSPDSGPNITPEKTFSLHAFANPIGESDLTLTPIMEIFSFSDGNKKLETRTLPSVTLAANTSTPIEIPMQALASPGVYTASIILQNPTSNVKASPAISYRWVVRGSSAQILSIRLISRHDRKDEKVQAEINVAGAADAETTTRAKLLFEVIDDGGVAGTLNVPDTLVLTDRVSSGVTNVTLSRDLQSNPKLHATLLSETGTPLDSYTIDLPPTEPEQVKPFSFEALLQHKLAILVAVVVIIILAIAGYVTRKRNVAKVPVAILALLSIGALYTYHVSTVSATNGIVVTSAPAAEDVDNDWRFLGSTPVVEMFINRPIHNNAYARDAVPVQLSVSYAVCGNRVGGTIIYADYLRNGGKISTQAPPAGNSFIRSWYSATTFIKNCPDDNCGENLGGPGKRFLVSGSYNGTFDFSQLDPNALNTTLRMFAKWDWNMETNYPSNYPSDKNVDITTGELNIIDLWVNTKPISDLSMTKTGPSSVVKGSDATYTLAVRNNGPANAANVVVTDSIPSGLTFKNATSTPSGTNCNASGSTVTCTIPSILNGATTNIALTFGTAQQAPNTACTASSIQNSATITASDSDDRTNTNNTSTASTTLACPAPVTVNLTVNGSDTPSPTTAGTPVTLAWTSTNATTCTATTDWSGNKATSGSEPVTPTSARTYTYTITCTNTTSGVSGNDTVSIVVNAASTPTPTPTPTATATTVVTAPNQSPIAIARLIKNGEAAASAITVTKGVQVTIALDSTDSSDPDGWTTAGKGMSSGGKCEWNSDLNQGTPTFETTIQNPANPGSCNTNATPFTRTFNDTPGTYTYTLLRLTDAAAEPSVSTAGTSIVSVTVVNPPTPTPTPTATPTITPTPVAGNNPPVSVAKISVNGSTPASAVTVTRGQSVAISLNAASSSDPDGWLTPLKGMSVGGKCEWNSDLNQGVATFEQTIQNPLSPSSCNISLGSLVFNDAPGTYPYTLLKLTDAALDSSTSNAATSIVTITVVTGPTPTPTPTITPTPSPVAGNNPPISVASMNVNGGAYSSTIIVSRDVPVQIGLSANGSSDPDGWNTPLKGVSSGGKCEWNSDLNQFAPTFETTISNPLSPAACSINLGLLTFHDTPGTYTYDLLRITDAALAPSVGGGATTVTVTVVNGPTPTPTATATPTVTPTSNPVPSSPATPPSTSTFNPGPFIEER